MSILSWIFKSAGVRRTSESATPAAPRSKSQPKLHRVYYLLAAFDLLAVLSGLALSHYTNGVLKRTVEANLSWSVLHDEVAQLRRAAGRINAPGNDVFDSKDATGETGRFNQAVGAYKPLIEKVRESMKVSVPHERQERSITALNAVAVAMDKMIAKSGELLSLFSTGKIDEASRRMAEMDRAYAEALGEIENASSAFRQLEAEMGKQALMGSANLQKFEFLLGLLILLMVSAVVVYGHKIGKLFMRQFDELDLQHRRIESTFQNMPHGLMWADANRQLVLCNDIFSRMFGLPASLSAAGAPVSGIVAYRAKTYAAPVEEDRNFLEEQELQAGGTETWRRVCQLKDGRYVSVSITPMTGGGLLASYTDITEQVRLEHKIAHLAHHDALTNLLNRHGFRSELDKATDGLQDGRDFALLFIDLDRFKEVNDAFGHPVGDALLNEIAGRLRRCVRTGDIIARMGGDEFAIIQKTGYQPEHSCALAAKVIEELSRPYTIDGNVLEIGASVGIALAPGDSKDPDVLLKYADLAVYKAKADGRGRFCVYENALDAAMQQRRALEVDLRLAVKKDQFELFYQPMIDSNSRNVVGYEGLLRWRHPVRGLVPPLSFIPLAEELGLMKAIGKWVIHRACMDAAKWPGGQSVSINVSAVQFREGRIELDVLAALGASGLPSHRLELEITESVLMENSEETLQSLQRLRACGVKIALDDFGTGYSSLSYLNFFAFDRIKIDRSFIQQAEKNQNSLAIIRAVMGLSESLGTLTTAEGIETAEQFELMKLEGCTQMQGYLFGKPVPLAEISHANIQDPPKPMLAIVS